MNKTIKNDECECNDQGKGQYHLEGCKFHVSQRPEYYYITEDRGTWRVHNENDGEPVTQPRFTSLEYAEAYVWDLNRQGREVATKKYTYIKGYENGHRFYRHNDSGKIVVGDQSGWRGGRYSVDWTDDGALFLDIANNTVRSGSHFSLPLLMADGSTTQTPCSKREAEFVRDAFGVQISRWEGGRVIVEKKPDTAAAREVLVSMLKEWKASGADEIYFDALIDDPDMDEYLTFGDMIDAA